MIAIIRKNIGVRTGCIVPAAALVFLGACATPKVPPTQLGAVSNQKIGDICEETMSLDVSGFYFSKCVDYLNSHAQLQKVAVNLTGPAEHRACSAIGLAVGSPQFESCVQEMYQLDLGAAHL